MQKNDIERVVNELGDQIAGLISEHSDDILKGYDAAGEEILAINIRATLKGNSDEVTRKVSLNFATEKVTDLSVDKTTLRQSEINFKDGDPANVA